VRSNVSQTDLAEARIVEEDAENSRRLSLQDPPPNQSHLLGTNTRSRMLSVPTAANLYNERILVQVDSFIDYSNFDC
jgi:hypothetical protein